MYNRHAERLQERRIYHLLIQTAYNVFGFPVAFKPFAAVVFTIVNIYRRGYTVERTLFRLGHGADECFRNGCAVGIRCNAPAHKRAACCIAPCRHPRAYDAPIIVYNEQVEHMMVAKPAFVYLLRLCALCLGHIFCFPISVAIARICKLIRGDSLHISV